MREEATSTGSVRKTLKTQVVRDGSVVLLRKGRREVCFRLSNKKTGAKAALVLVSRNDGSTVTLEEGRFSHERLNRILVEVRAFLNEPSLTAADVNRNETGILPAGHNAPCLCGCGALPAGNFRVLCQGHDATLRAKAARISAGESTAEAEGITDAAVARGLEILSHYSKAS